MSQLRPQPSAVNVYEGLRHQHDAFRRPSRAPPSILYEILDPVGCASRRDAGAVVGRAPLRVCVGGSRPLPRSKSDGLAQIGRNRRTLRGEIGADTASRQLSTKRRRMACGVGVRVRTARGVHQYPV